MPASCRLLFSLALTCSSAFAQHASAPAEPLPTAEAIMARVAANQDNSDVERTHYVYIQHAHIVSRKGKTLMCEEVTDSRVAPTADGSHVELVKLDGRYLLHHQYATYTALPKHGGGSHTDGEHDVSISLGDDEMDRELVEDMRSNLTNTKSKDGIGARLFPLTSKTQSGYLFHLVGRDHMNGREVFHVEFHPKDKDEYDWKGDAYIDTAAYQPVVVTTKLAHKVPFVVRTALGTNVPGFGFTVVYAPQPDGVWFPVTFGTEFKIRVLFFFNRQIIIDAENRSFEKTHVTSRIVSSAPPEPLKP